MQKLKELGWVPQDTENKPYALEAEEYNLILTQPTVLNDSSKSIHAISTVFHAQERPVWKRTRPRLERILTARRSRRMEQEKRERWEQRVINILSELSSLAHRVAPKEGFTPHFLRNWHHTFPVTDQQLLLVPSLSLLAEDDNTGLVSDAFKAQESRIVEDLYVFQMRTRRALVSLMRSVEAAADGPRVSQRETFFSAFWDSSDIPTLETDDPANIIALNKPTALFLLSDELCPMCEAYPFNISHEIAVHYVLKRMAVVYALAVQLLKALRLEDASMEYMLDLGCAFCCECCPVGIHRLFSWTQLVSGCSSSLRCTRATADTPRSLLRSWITTNKKGAIIPKKWVGKS